MPVDFATVYTVVANTLNAIGDPRWTTQEILEAIQATDGLVCAAVMENANNVRAKEFYVIEFVGVTGTQVGGVGSSPGGWISGPIVSVQFHMLLGSGFQTMRVAAVPWDPTEIGRESMDSFDPSRNIPLPLPDPHYHLDGAVIYHNLDLYTLALFEYLGGGTGIGSVSGGVEVTLPRFIVTSAGQAPTEYTFLVIAGAMALLVPVEGENAGPQGTWAQMFAQGLQAIRSTEGNLPSGLQQQIQQRVQAA